MTKKTNLEKKCAFFPSSFLQFVTYYECTLYNDVLLCKDNVLVNISFTFLPIKK